MTTINTSNIDLTETTENFDATQCDKIVEMLNDKDNDSALPLLKKQLLTSLIYIISTAEEGVKDSKGAKGTYGYVQLVREARGLVSDLEALQDAGLIAQAINVNYVEPTFLNLIQFIIDNQFRLRNAIQEVVNDPKHVKKINSMLEETSKATAIYAQSKMDELKQQIHDRITG